jgi:hypothetical protein
MNHDPALTTINRRLYQRYLRIAVVRRFVFARQESPERSPAQASDWGFDLCNQFVVLSHCLQTMARRKATRRALSDQA